jgi:cytochrome c
VRVDRAKIRLGDACVSRYIGFITEIRLMSRNQPADVTSPSFRSIFNLKTAALSLAAASLAAAAIFWQSHYAATQAIPASNSAEFYTQRVRPIFLANCYRCHGGFNHRGGLKMTTRAGLLRGGHDGAIIVPGNPGQSLLIQLIRHQGPVNDPRPMPPKSKISDADITTVTQWIQAGAVMPPDQP